MTLTCEKLHQEIVRVTRCPACDAKMRQVNWEFLRLKRKFKSVFFSTISANTFLNHKTAGLHKVRSEILSENEEKKK